ncbi:hypothetical protein L596_018777 [Steinernema carpocapsae]|uniref:Uncharacterized protein n=1 Tax=Steinernema carpocapsae TaxID=34508 RepID=A0A4U5N5P6_STECR|nr:hypothetical protein L596_018777 [Steinernema carpocapsae]
MDFEAQRRRVLWDVRWRGSLTRRYVQVQNSSLDLEFFRCEDDSWDSSETSKPKKSRLVLSGIANQFDYIESFVVHSCDHLVIPNDTFTGVSIHDQLKLVGIGRVDFRPHAFRRIRRSPRHFVVQNAGVTRIPKHAFSGLDSIEHFWWRNVTISSIDSFAFADVSKVEYVYFRDARVTHLHRNAFGRMSSIGNFYLRENIHIGRLGVGVFDSSQLAEVIFEDAQVSASDGAHLATFDNAKIAHLQLLNSRFDLCYRNPVAKSVRKCQVDKLTVVNSVFDRLLPENFCQIATFENATIASLGPSDDFNVPAPFSVAVVNFVHSHIGKITAGAFRNSRIDQLRFDKSDINFLARRSFYGSEILRISFADSSIDDAGASEPPPFDGGQFGEVAFARGFLRATTNLFARSTVSSSVEFTSIHFGVIVGALFMDSKIANVTFRDCNFDTLKGPFFDNTTVDTLDISKSRFSEELPDDFFEGGLASETKRFLMRDCEVFCNLKACEKNALLLRPIIHDLSWKFRRNRCSNAAERPCAELRVQDKGGLACRQRHAIEECVCMGPMALGIPGIRIPPSNASILVLGDCRQVTVTAENRSKNVHIYLYRVEQLVVKSVTPTLRRLEILHSNVVLEGAFAWGNRSLSSISLVDSNVKRIGPNAFSGARIDRIVFNDSQIGLVHSKAFENSSIRSMRVIRSRLFDADYSLPQEIAQISIDDSLIEQNHRLFHVDHIDLGEAEKSEDDCSLLNQRIRSINRRFVCGRRMSRSPLGRIAAIVARCERKDCAEAKVPDSALRIHFSSILFLFSLFLWI